MAGRPTIYTDELAQEILKRIEGGESTRSICRDQKMPSRSTVNLWIKDNASFSAQYVRAKEIQADDEFDHLRSLAREALDSPEKTQALKLVIDTDKWVLSKKIPKKYGDRIEQIHKTIDDDGKETGFKLVSPPDASPK